MAKTKRIIARVSDEQWKKLKLHIDSKGQTVTKWVGDRIDLMRTKK